MARNARNGKYVEYEKQIVTYLIEHSEMDSVYRMDICNELNLSRSSIHDVISKMKKRGSVNEEKVERFYENYHNRVNDMPGVVSKISLTYVGLMLYSQS